MRHRPQLSPVQLVAGALAAVTAAVLASYLGVAGTVAGAAVASVVSVTGNAVYGAYLNRTVDRVRTVAAPRRVDPSASPTERLERIHVAAGRQIDWTGLLRSLPWARLAGTVAVLFLAVLGVVTVVQHVAAGAWPR